MKTKLLIPLLVLIHLLAVSVTAQVNYAVSGDTAYVARSPGASGAIVIASTFNGYPVTVIGHSAFAGCTNLTSVTIPDSVTFIGEWAFQNCTSLSRVTIPNSVTGIWTWAFQNCTSLTNVIIGNSVTSLRSSAFAGCTSLTSVVIPNSITAIDDSAFSGCSSLTNVIIGNSVTSLRSLVFAACTSLTSVTIPNSVISIGPAAFFGCTSLTNLSVDAAHPAFGSLNGVLFNKAQTTLTLFPPGRGGRYVIPDSVTSIGTRAFSDCTSLTNVTIPNSVTNMENYAFSGCASLKSVIIPNSVTTIGSSAFHRCTSLASVTIGNSVTSIGNEAFVGCTSLTRITIPNSVTSIGDAAFMSCTSLTNFTFLGNAPGLVLNWHVGGFHQFAGVGADAKVYYYCGATGWGTNYGGRPPLPTVMLCPSQIGAGSAGVKPGGFGFTLNRLTNQTVVEASTDLLNWQPIWTNTLPGTTAEFLDPQVLPNRFYRARSN